MCYNFNSSNSKLDKVMTDDQFDRVVEAILSGKYSWACLLILRFSGYNPLHYIPYRTYNRLMKGNQEKIAPSPKKTKSTRKSSSVAIKSQQKSSSSLRDLYYLEKVDDQSVKVKGGMRICLADFTLDRHSSFYM